MSMHHDEGSPATQRRRRTDDSPSGGMVPTAMAASMLGLTPNGFRKVVERGLIKPAFTFRNTNQPITVYWREQVERLAESRRRYAEMEPRLRVALGLAPEPQLALKVSEG